MASSVEQLNAGMFDAIASIPSSSPFWLAVLLGASFVIYSIVNGIREHLRVPANRAALRRAGITAALWTAVTIILGPPLAVLLSWATVWVPLN